MDIPGSDSTAGNEAPDLLRAWRCRHDPAPPAPRSMPRPGSTLLRTPVPRAVRRRPAAEDGRRDVVPLPRRVEDLAALGALPPRRLLLWRNCRLRHGPNSATKWR